MVEASERVNVSVAVSAAFKEATSELTAMVGLKVSIVRMSELLESEPSGLVLPEESEKTLDATEITPSAVLLVEGVKVAE